MTWQNLRNRQTSNKKTKQINTETHEGGHQTTVIENCFVILSDVYTYNFAPIYPSDFKVAQLK